ncbi:hypothetical protein BKA93DRAFT_733998 [Sparassis latifolia]
MDVAVLPSAIRVQQAVPFSFTSRSEATIDVLSCPKCHHHRRSIGPDIVSLDIFNWNNMYLFMHELLNAFTSAFTALETPFSTFCLTTRCSYEDNSSEMHFCLDETFVQVWSAFIHLQCIDSEMHCPTCGPSLSIIIINGVSLMTHCSKLTLAVRLLTFTDQSSEQIESIFS